MGSSTKRAEKSTVGAAKAAPAGVRSSSEADTGDQRSHAGKASTTRKLPPPPRKRTSAVSPAAPRKAADRAASTPAATVRKATAPFARKPVFEELEPRFLMSADLNPLATDALFATPSQQPAEFRALADPGTPDVVTTATVAPIHRANELVFVDTATPDYQSLVDAMRTAAQADGINLEFVLIDAERDRVANINETLGQKLELDAIHVISHARDGAVQLGSTQLDFETLLKRAGQIKSWGNALSEDGDILFYGCDLAASQEGKSLLEALSRLTGADVAASENVTGAATLGGDWNLEFRTGAIEAPVLVSLPEAGEWDHLLATFTVTNTGDSGNGSLRDAINSANTAGSNDTIVFNIPTSDPGYSAGTGKFTINLQSALPTIGGAGTGNLLIDGWSEGVFLGTSGYNGDPLIMLNGSGAGNNVSGLTIQNAQSTGSEIRGLIISNFREDGIHIDAGANNVWIHGNWIGLSATGAGAGNQGDGIEVSATGATIGGPAGADRNVISDNGANGTAFGIITSGNGTVIQGNYIGTNATGTAQLQNSEDGIRIGSNSNTVLGNVIGFNGHDGLEIAGGDSNIVRGNYIGTDLTGTINLAANSGNQDDAIDISGDSDLNIIGGVGAGEGNVLANAFGAGVRSDRNADDTADQNRIRGNSIYNNGDGGILLHDFVQEASGAFDPDTGANQGQNYPSLAGATVAFVGGNMQISNITLSTTANSTYAIDFYANPAAGSLQGKRYLGSTTTLSTGSGGTVTFSATLSSLTLAGERITATATSLTGGEVGNTSPFSTTFITVPPNNAPTLSAAALNPSFTEAAGQGTQAAAVNVYGSAATGTVEPGQSIIGLTFTMSGLLDGASERIVVDGTTITLGANSSGTTATNGMTYNVAVAAGTATVSLTKAAGVSTGNINTLVNGITYQNTNTDNPSAGNRVFTLTQLQDSGGTVNGGADTATLSIASTVTVVAVNDEPTLSATASNPTYTEDGSAVSLFSATSAATVEASQTLTRLDLTVSNLSNGTAEQLTIDGTTVLLTNGSGTTTGSAAMAYTVTVSGTTATVSLTKGAGISSAAMQTLVNAIAYRNTSQDPTAGARVVTLTRLDDSGSNVAPNDNTATLSIASTVTVVAVNDEPTLSATASNPTYTEDGSAVSLFSATSAATVEASQTLTRLDLTVSNLSNGAAEQLTVDGTTRSEERRVGK